MAKHLKLRGKLVDNNTRVEVEIIEQTHLGTDFGEVIPNYEQYGAFGFLHENVMLYSYGTIPNVFAPGGGRPLLMVCVKGTHQANSVFVCSLSQWAQIKSAVEAYNEWGNDK